MFYIKINNHIIINSNVFSIIIIVFIYFIGVFNSAVKRLIAINRIQNKRFCLHNISVCTVYIYYVYINTNTCMYIFKKITLCLYIKCIYI